ncbi:NUDIX domain-containing protein [Aestuariivirga sp.]|uniref:NUDIX domain-containing protein n=1 Tax=Aestuariivirga sp. TaxID=2650926 RepID=UPI003594420C
MLKRVFFKTAQKLVMQPLYRQMRGMTLGTRTLIVRPSQEVLLVRHTYAPGWLLPGGGVERGETLYQAAIREVREEAAITAEEEPRLHGMFLNDRQFPGDHVACFVLRAFSEGRFQGNLEIAEARFFSVGALPPDTTGGTRRRIAEVLDGVAPTRDW